MKYSTASILTTAFWTLTLAASLEEREVPQEHSHEQILAKVRETLNLNNPDKIQDPTFALLGDAGAAKGAGNIKDPACLQQSVADQAFTNAKKTNDIDAMTNAVLFRALERNSGAVGKESGACTTKAKNPEIAAVSQHQDPASPDAAEKNKKVVLEAAKQIASFGGDPQLAAMTATFAPGKLGDPTAAGNTCDDQDDKVGCIFTKKLIQVEATPDEITAATKSVSKNKKRHNGNGKFKYSTILSRRRLIIEDHLDGEKHDSVPKSSFLKKRNASTNSIKLNSKRGLSFLQGKESQVTSSLFPGLTYCDTDDFKALHKRDDDDNRKGRGKGRNGRNRGNRNNDNDDKKKRDNDDNGNDNDNDNGNDNDNDFKKRDDDDNGNDNDNDKRAASGVFDITLENVQKFTGSLGGPPPAVIESAGSDRPFTVNGNTFVGKSVALQRSCSIQKNSCARAANSGTGSVSDCEKQEEECSKLANSANKRSISSPALGNRQRINRRRNTTQIIKRQKSDFGSCSDPTVEFKAGFDGRTKKSFKAKNLKDFDHGSTQKLKITSEFICEKLQSSCKAPQETVDKCLAASKAAESLSGQAAADAFNKGVGA
ncbi:hypothetical protein GcM1_238138 [Golovinomyces cichoracearum]|uniref:Ribosomal protein s17 n=1 Tax=Golovinomyces cichoracearum TaxID=62708 RepID=A0A420IJN4_9PEZI|nr:hypothetical protein GcM1_238138 [Golovinomyces cichoracearum]